jgi:hypothetical protein
MPRLDRTGPDGKGLGTGRKLGKCSKATDEEKINNLGKGLGKKNNSGGGQGKGNRLKSGLR